MCVLVSAYARHEERPSLLHEKKGVEVCSEDECDGVGGGGVGGIGERRNW